MPASFDRLADELDYLHAALGIERVQDARKVAAIRGEQERLVIKRQFRARSVHARNLCYSLVSRTRTWSRLLTSIGFGGPTYFPHVDIRETLASSKLSKEARILAGIVLAALATLSLAGVIFAQFSSFKNEIATLKRDLAGMTEKVAKLEANVAAALTPPEEMKGGADARMLRGPDRTPQAPFALTRDEIQLIRDFIKVPPPLYGAAQTINVGDLLPDTALFPPPEPIIEKLPKLRGARFTVDRNSAIVVVPPGTNRVDVVINPS